MKAQFERRSEYGVHLYISIRSSETDEEIGSQTESEYYSSHSKAEQVADKYRKQIGEVICCWGDDTLGYLDDLDVDDDPVINEYPILPGEGERK